jgi:hypothetical protein
MTYYTYGNNNSKYSLNEDVNENYPNLQSLIAAFYYINKDWMAGKADLRSISDTLAHCCGPKFAQDFVQLLQKHFENKSTSRIIGNPSKDTWGNITDEL